MSAPTVPAKQWLLGYILHNLTCKKPFDSEYMAIAPHSDPRVQQIVATSQLRRCLVENFTDQLGSQRHPSVLVVREDAPETVRDIDAVVSFRNLFAISCVIFGQQQSIRGPNVRGTLYSDYFDFYPIMITPDGTGVWTMSPALNDFDYPKEIHGKTSPSLPRTECLGVEPDEMLVNRLIEAWSDLYIGTRRFEREATVLFRSLQVAYHAAAMPVSNLPSIHDYGVRIGLWISAFEILAHPAVDGIKNKVNFDKVKELLGKQTWSKAELRDCKHDVHYDSKCHKVNLVVKIYRDLYEARNKFMHGNPVSPENLFPFKNNKRPPLTHLAPLIYKTALLGFLDRFQFRPKESAPDLNAMKLSNLAIDRAVACILKKEAFENAILEAIHDRE